MLSPAIVGSALPLLSSQWSSRDCLLYALGIGAGQADAAQELQFTTENSQGHPQQVYPTYGVLPGAEATVRGLLGTLGDAVSITQLLHADQRYEQLRLLPAAASVSTEARVVAAWDKQNATVFVTEADITDATTGEVYGRSTQSMFFRGVGGWGGDRGPSRVDHTPDRTPDRIFTVQIRPDQALLYRLSGDPNPLHSDPAVAALAGFERPILHGLCSYGVTGRLLLNEFAAGNPGRFGSLYARFNRPTFPGDTLHIRTWVSDEQISFVVVNQRDDVVLTDGAFVLVPGAEALGDE